MMARSTTRSTQRPDTLMQDRISQADENSCNARPDHTSGSKAALGQCRLQCPVCPKAVVETYRRTSRSLPLSAPFREVTFCASYKCHCFGVKGSRLSWFRG